MPNLKDYDIYLLLDKSGSMSTPDGPGGISRWKQAQEATEALARKAMEYDDDGISVVPFNNSVKVYENTTPESVSKVFAENEPNGGTDTALALKTVLSDYFNKRDQGNAKPRIIAVVTDGAPNDRDAVANAIVEATKKCQDNGEGDTDELGITFLQVGGDTGATSFLQFLDDELVSKRGAKFDIVDTKTFAEMENMTLTDVLLESLTD